MKTRIFQGKLLLEITDYMVLQRIDLMTLLRVDTMHQDKEDL